MNFFQMILDKNCLVNNFCFSRPKDCSGDLMEANPRVGLDEDNKKEAVNTETTETEPVKVSSQLHFLLTKTQTHPEITAPKMPPEPPKPIFFSITHGSSKVEHNLTYILKNTFSGIVVE